MPPTDFLGLPLLVKTASIRVEISRVPSSVRRVPVI